MNGYVIDEIPPTFGPAPAVTWQVTNPRTNEVIGRYATFDEAEAAARGLPAV